MTGYTVHTGSSVKFSVGWDRIFPKANTAAAPAAKTSTVGKSTGKAAAKKSKKAVVPAAKKSQPSAKKKKAAAKRVKRGK